MSESAEATGSAESTEPGRSEPDPWKWDRNARRQEALVACHGTLGLAVPIVMFAVLGLLRGGTSRLVTRIDDPRMWASSLLILGMLLIALQLVLLLLAFEHVTAEIDPRADAPLRWLIGTWAFRLAITLIAVAAIYWSAPSEQWAGPWQIGTVTWAHAGWALLASQLVTLPLCWGLGHRVRQIALVPPGELVGREFHGVEHVPGERSGGTSLLAIGASGGGLRAASFVLGGHQATQEASPGLGIDATNEPEVFAVSGGSYIAGAIALRRRFERNGTSKASHPWVTSYATGSPEVQRLRRHTRYLFEPAARLRDGVVTLLVGAAINLLLVGLALRAVVWISAQLAVSLQLVDVGRQGADTGLIHPDVVTSLTSHFGADWRRVLGVPLALLLVVLVLTLITWGAAASFDRVSRKVGDQSAVTRPGAAHALKATARLRPIVILVALGWLSLTFLLPGATVGVAKLAAANHPTTTVASWLTSLGLVDENLCRSAVARHLDEAAGEATALARLDPGTRQTVTAGGCGFELDIHRTYAAATAAGQAGQPDDVAPVSSQPPTSLTTAEKRQLREYLDRHPSGPGGQVAGIAGLLAVLGGLLRRATAPSAPVPQGRFAGVRTRLLTLLPLTIATLLAAYLSVLWFRGLVSRVAAPDSPYFLQTTVLATVIGCLIAFLLDANVTSMHRYYRASLSSAFAVGATDETAEELPLDRVYSFSALGNGPGDPRLNIVTTLNTQAPGETPTLRGGVPVVFSPGAVYVSRDPSVMTRIDTRAYERLAGPGRVSVLATIGISGAAVSPLMGRFDEQMAPYRLLLAVFNLRLGVWTRNPMHTPELPVAEVGVGGRHRRRMGPGVLWITEKPGLMQMILEAVGRSSADRRWVYLSDGGHLDNTGLVECVRRFQGRRAGRILVLDASNDPVDSWSAVGDAVAVLRADLGVDLRMVPWPDEAPGPIWARRYAASPGGAPLDVLVVKAVPLTPPPSGTPDACWDLLTPDLHSFVRRHPDFPRASTARQKFGDLEFEAYRQLGFIATTEAFKAAGWLAR